MSQKRAWNPLEILTANIDLPPIGEQCKPAVTLYTDKGNVRAALY